MPWYDPSTWREKAIPVEAPATPALLPAPYPNPPYAPPVVPTPENPNAAPLDIPVGTTGLRRAGGYIYEELLPKLAGLKAARVYREMSDNSPIVGAVLYTIEMFMRQAQWRTEPNESRAPRAAEAAEFFDDCIDDMEHTWDEFLAEVLTMLPFGWQYSETVFKRRQGPAQADPKLRSRFTDGRIGLRKLAPRSQDTLLHWAFDSEGTVTGLHQQDPWGGSTTVLIPLNRALHFKTTSRKSNPEGRSLLRTAYRNWWFGKRLEEIEAIGIERDLAGLPIIRLPPEKLAPNATAAQKAEVAQYLKLVQQVRRDEREGVVFPASEMSDGKKTGYSFELMSSGGRRSIDTTAVITRHEQRIAMSMLAEFIFLGTQNVGSWSLASTKTSLFSKSVGGHMENIASTINRQLIPRLMGLNGYSADEYPKVVYGDIETPDLADVAAYINQLVGAGVLTPDDALERKLREMANLPEMPDKPPGPRTPPPAKPGAPGAPPKPQPPKPPPAPGGKPSAGKPSPTFEPAGEDPDNEKGTMKV